MKYMTKDWYEAMQKTDLHLLLKVSERAEHFSEAYFRELYQREEKKWLKLQKKISEVRFEDIFPGELYAEHADGSPLNAAESDETEKAYHELREQARLNFEDRPPFDPGLQKTYFRRMLRAGISDLKKKLPGEILRETADIRVLALHYASADVKKRITAYCRQNRTRVRRAVNAWHREYRKQFASEAPSFAAELRLHDCRVLSCRKKGKDIELTIDYSGGCTDIHTIRFRNGTVIRQEGLLHGARFLYEELYRTGNGYEIHFLLEKNRLTDYIVSADDLEYRHG